MKPGVMALPAVSKDGCSSLDPMTFRNPAYDSAFERLRIQRACGKFCDVVILVKDRQFVAHRCVLAACSPFFDSTLKGSKIIKEKVVFQIDFRFY